MENMRSIQYANVSQRRSRIDGFRTGLGYRTHQWDRFLRGKIVCRCGFLVICVLCFGGRDGHSAHAGDLHLAGVVHSGIGGVAGDRPGDSAPPAATIGTQGKFLPVDDRGAWLAGDGKSRLLRLANGKALRFCAGIVACTGDSYVGGGAGIQCVQQLGVAEKHRRLILLGGDGIPYVCIGIGCGLFGHGMGNVISERAINSYPELKRQLDIEKNDERNVAIANRAKGKAFDMMTFVFGALMLSFALMGIDMVAVLLLVFAYLLVHGFALYYRFKFDKEM